MYNINITGFVFIRLAFSYFIKFQSLYIVFRMENPVRQTAQSVKFCFPSPWYLFDKEKP